MDWGVLWRYCVHAISLEEVMTPAIKINAQVLHFRVGDADIKVYIDLSSVGRSLPVRIKVDSGGPVRVEFPPFSDRTTYLPYFPVPTWEESGPTPPTTEANA
jgi:hypothetical protein